MEDNIKKKLKQMNKQQLQQIYNILYQQKSEDTSKKDLIEILLKPLKKTYKMDIELNVFPKFLKKFEYTSDKCWNFVNRPDVCINSVYKRNNDFYYNANGKHIQLQPTKYLGKGSHGSVILLTDTDNMFQFALKEIEKLYYKDTLEIDDEIVNIKKLEKNNVLCDLIPVRMLEENDNYWYVIMPKYTGDLKELIGKLSTFEIINLGVELGGVYQCLLQNYLYYTDSKASQVLYKCISSDIVSIRLGDIGSMFELGENSTQTFPFPPENGYKDFFKDGEKASEHVVVWGFVLLLLSMISKNINNNIIRYLGWKNLKITKYENTFHSFRLFISNELQTNPMKDFFETFLGIKEDIYDMVRKDDYTMKNVIDYLTGYPFLIKEENTYSIPSRNLKQLQNLSLDCWKRNTRMNAKYYTIYVNSEIVSYGILDQNTLWSLCTSSKKRGKGYAKKIIDEMFKDVCKNGERSFYLFVDENSPKKWYQKLGFEYIPLSYTEQQKYNGEQVQKMFRECNK
jgi:ribosomal protein S18 acetylase RimI-like enzyme